MSNHHPKNLKTQILKGIYIQVGVHVRTHVNTLQHTQTHILAEQTQTLLTGGGAVLYPYIAKGRGDEVQKKN